MKKNKWWFKLDKRSGVNPLLDKWKNASTRATRQSVIVELMETYPKIVDYLWNRAETCFGLHRVYLVHIRYGEQDYIKVGYTKNAIEARFGETRYAGHDQFLLVRVIREAELQALGAVRFEAAIKSRVETIRTDMVMPGKGELFEMSRESELTELWDRTIREYEQVIGLKAPN